MEVVGFEFRYYVSRVFVPISYIIYTGPMGATVGEYKNNHKAFADLGEILSTYNYTWKNGKGLCRSHMEVANLNHVGPDTSHFCSSSFVREVSSFPLI